MARTATTKRAAKPKAGARKASTKPKANARKTTTHATASRSSANKLGATKRGGPTRKELYEQLRERGVEGISRLSKDEMADLLRGKRRRA